MVTGSEDGRRSIHGPWAIGANFSRMSDAKLIAGDLRAVLVKHAKFCDRVYQVKGTQAFRAKPTPIVLEWAKEMGFEWGVAPLSWGHGLLMEEFPYIVTIGTLLAVFHFDCDGLGDGGLSRFLRAKGAEVVEGRVLTVVVQGNAPAAEVAEHVIEELSQFCQQGTDGSAPELWPISAPWASARAEEESELSVRLSTPLLCSPFLSHDKLRFAVFVNFYNPGTGARALWHYLEQAGFTNLSARVLSMQTAMEQAQAKALLADNFFSPPPPAAAPAAEPVSESMQEILRQADEHLDRLQISEALTVLRAYLAEHPRDIEGLVLLARAYAMGEQESRAISMYQRALSLEPQHHGALMGLGLLLQQLGQHREAVGIFQRAAAISPDAQGHYCLAQAWKELGEPAKALDAIALAIEAEPSFVPALVFAADLQAELSQFDEAKTLYQRVLTVSPLHRGAREALTQILAREQPPQEAQRRKPWAGLQKAIKNFQDQVRKLQR